VLIAADLTVAQEASFGGESTNAALIPGALQDFGSMGPRGTRRFCDPRVIGLAQWRTTALADILGLDQPQQAALTALSKASAKALKLIQRPVRIALVTNPNSRWSKLDSRPCWIF
jgi:hypothetical protein